MNKMELLKVDKALESHYQYIFDRHTSVNQMYDVYPYSFHLELVKNIALNNIDSLKYISNIGNIFQENIILILLSAAGHDLLEDTRMTYNDLAKYLNNNSDVGRQYRISKGAQHMICETIYALTDEKGRNRSERHNSVYWKTLKSNTYAPFIKMCDRYANMMYSKYFSKTNNTMSNKYFLELNELEDNIGDCDGVKVMLEKCRNL